MPSSVTVLEATAFLTRHHKWLGHQPVDVQEKRSAEICQSLDAAVHLAALGFPDEVVIATILHKIVHVNGLSAQDLMHFAGPTITSIVSEVVSFTFLAGNEDHRTIQFDDLMTQDAAAILLATQLQSLRGIVRQLEAPSGYVDMKKTAKPAAIACRDLLTTASNDCHRREGASFQDQERMKILFNDMHRAIRTIFRHEKKQQHERSTAETVPSTQ